uniref:Uncharacterized protein n=1 Tax=Zea mays TaxID=4577 RepID=A0A804UIJ9_MAIZE
LTLEHFQSSSPSRESCPNNGHAQQCPSASDGARRSHGRAVSGDQEAHVPRPATAEPPHVPQRRRAERRHPGLHPLVRPLHAGAEGRGLRLPPRPLRRRAAAGLAVRCPVVEQRQPALPLQGGGGGGRQQERRARRRRRQERAGGAVRASLRRGLLPGEEPEAVAASGASGQGTPRGREGRRRAGAHGAGRGRGGLLHEPVRAPRVVRRRRRRARGVRVGGRRRRPVPGPVRVAVPPAGVRPAGAAAGAAQRGRGHGRRGDQRGQHGRRRGHQPVRRRLLPGRPRLAAGGRHGVRGRVRQRRVPRVRRAAARGPGHGRQLQRARCAREEVPAPGAVRPRHVGVLHAGVV